MVTRMLDPALAPGGDFGEVFLAESKCLISEGPTGFEGWLVLAPARCISSCSLNSACGGGKGQHPRRCWGKPRPQAERSSLQRGTELPLGAPRVLLLEMGVVGTAGCGSFWCDSWWRAGCCKHLPRPGRNSHQPPSYQPPSHPATQPPSTGVGLGGRRRES